MNFTRFGVNCPFCREKIRKGFIASGRWMGHEPFQEGCQSPVGWFGSKIRKIARQVWDELAESIAMRPTVLTIPSWMWGDGRPGDLVASDGFFR